MAVSFLLDRVNDFAGGALRVRYGVAFQGDGVPEGRVLTAYTPLLDPTDGGTQAEKDAIIADAVEAAFAAAEAAPTELGAHAAGRVAAPTAMAERMERIGKGKRRVTAVTTGEGRVIAVPGTKPPRPKPPKPDPGDTKPPPGGDTKPPRRRAREG